MPDKKLILKDMPVVEPGNKVLPCDGCFFIKMGRIRDGFPDSKSRSCSAGAEHISGCVINEKKRKIWVEATDEQ